MFEVGFSEILVIMAIALVVLGPEKLPRLAMQVGRWVGRAKAMARQFREQLEEEANKLDVVKDLKKDFDLSKEMDLSTPQPPPATPDPVAVPEPHIEPHPPDPHAEASVDSAQHERRH